MKKKHLWRLYPGRYIEQNPCAAGSSHRLPGGDSPELVGTIRSPAARPAGSAQVAGASNHHQQSGGLGHRRQRRKPTAQRRALQKAHKKPSRRTNTQFLQSFLPSALTHRSRLFFAAVWPVGWRYSAPWPSLQPEPDRRKKRMQTPRPGHRAPVMSQWRFRRSHSLGCHLSSAAQTRRWRFFTWVVFFPV